MVVQLSAMVVLLLGSLAPGQMLKTQRPKTQPGEPLAQLLVENRVVDLGRLKQGEKGTARFILENRGTAPLHITKVRTSCGCTVSRPLTEDEKTLEPGESLALEAVFDSRGRLGMQRKTVTVMSDDSVEPRLQLVLTAEVVTVMEVLINGRALRTIALGKVGAGEEVAAKIEALPTDPGESLEITSVTVQSEVLRYKLEPLSKDDRTGYLVKLSVTPDAIPGPISAPMRIDARIGKESASVNIRAVGEVVGELVFTPRQIRQTSPMPIGSKLAPIKVLSETRKPFEILSVAAGPNLEMDVTDQRGGYEYRITPRIGESAKPGPFGVFLDIRTSSVVQPVIRIPVFGYVRPHIEAYPPIVLLRQEGTGESSARTVKLETARRGRLNITGILVDSPYLTARQTDALGVSTIGVQYVRLELTGSAPSGTHDVVVRVQTDVQAQPEVIIPVTLMVP